MLAKLIVISFLIVILYVLGSGLYFLIYEKDNDDRVAKALTWRVGLSLLLFILLFVAYAFGWLVPHAI